jgi:DNA-binding NarL/FixJ family response regulator
VSQRISVLLVDDHALVRQGFRRLLEDDPSISVVAEAGDGDAAIELAQRLRPGVIVMDWTMPGTPGLAATRRILQDWPEAVVLMVSVHGERAVERQAIAAGVRGYVRKDAVDFDLAAAVRRLAAGGSLQQEPSPARASGLPSPRLSPRRQQILQMLCEGCSSGTIASRLGVSVNTVSAHRARMMKAFGVHRTAELVAYAMRNGLVELS